MNLWDYFEQEAKKHERVVKCVPRLLVNYFSSNWNTLISIHLLASQNDHLLTVCQIMFTKRKVYGIFWSALSSKRQILLKCILLYHF